MYKIILDSCGDLTEDLKQDTHFCNVPLTVTLDTTDIVDDESFNQLEFLEMVHRSANEPKSSCPSPQLFLQEIDCDAKNIYIITMSSKISGSYNSAVLAKRLYEDTNDDKNIVVFDSKSASVSETLLALKIQELEEKHISFEIIVETILQLIDEIKTFFVLETLETFRKSGRLNGIKSLAVTVLNIVPIMGAKNGEIIQLGQQRGHKKAINDMISRVCSEIQQRKTNIVGITHCNCLELAKSIEQRIIESYPNIKCFLVNAGGVATMYMNQGGIVIAV